MNTIKDIAIILVALLSIASLSLWIAIGLQVWDVVKLVRREIKPLIAETQQTLATVRGTTTFISSEVMTPMVKQAGTLAGVARGWSVLSDWRQLRQRRDRRATERENS